MSADPDQLLRHAESLAERAWCASGPDSAAEQLGDAVKTLVPILRDLYRQVVAFNDTAAELREANAAMHQRLDAADELAAEQQEHNG